MTFKHSLSVATSFVTFTYLAACQSTLPAANNKGRAIEVNDVPHESNVQKTWGLIISPIDLWAVNSKEEIVLWHSRYPKNGEVYTSQEDCEKHARIYEKKNPPRYNMEVKCISPAPGTVPYAVIDLKDMVETPDK